MNSRTGHWKVLWATWESQVDEAIRYWYPQIGVLTQPRHILHPSKMYYKAWWHHLPPVQLISQCHSTATSRSKWRKGSQWPLDCRTQERSSERSCRSPCPTDFCRLWTLEAIPVASMEQLYYVCMRGHRHWSPGGMKRGGGEGETTDAKREIEHSWFNWKVEFDINQSSCTDWR